ncbi:MAG: cell division protein FtsZ [Rubrivivax sp.]|nr:cell division protein FtsZ [Rubrivivax sp.]
MTLTTALAILGALVLLGLVAQAWWNTRKARPRQTLHSQPDSDRVEPAMDAVDTQPDEPPPLRSHLKPSPRLDALIDALVPLALEAPVSGEHALMHLPPSRRAGTKPFYIEGLDTETGTWETLAPGRRYGELQAGVQLANRSGALNEIEYSEFLQKIEAFAEAISARADAPDMLEVVARARELDALAGPLDAQLSITLRTNSVAWSVGFVQQVAMRQGLVAGSMKGRWVLPAAEEGAPPMLTLSVDAQAAMAEDPQSAVVRECQLALDVPQTPASVEPFPAWHLMSKQLADELDATAVDDHGEPITLHAFDAIGKEIDELYSRLEQLDLAAGSPAARRLFS